MDEKTISINSILPVIGNEIHWHKSNDHAYADINKLIGEKEFRLKELAGRHRLFGKESYLIEAISGINGIMNLYKPITVGHGGSKIRQSMYFSREQWHKVNIDFDNSFPTDIINSYVAGLLIHIRRSAEIIYRMMPKPKDPNTDYSRAVVCLYLDDKDPTTISIELILNMDIQQDMYRVKKAVEYKHMKI